MQLGGHAMWSDTVVQYTQDILLISYHDQV